MDSLQAVDGHWKTLRALVSLKTHEVREGLSPALINLFTQSDRDALRISGDRGEPTMCQHCCGGWEKPRDGFCPACRAHERSPSCGKDREPGAEELSQAGGRVCWVGARGGFLGR